MRLRPVRLRPVRLLPMLLALGGCAPLRPVACAVAGDDTVAIVDHGWHTDIGLPAGELHGPLAALASMFPGARSFLFGFGKRTFFTARVESWQEYLLGPLPGPGAILVTALRVMPTAAYADAVVLHLPPGGARALSAFLWGSLAHEARGAIRPIAAGPYPGSLFYAATARYGLGHTCNAWTAEAATAAGAPVSPAGVVFAGQVMRRARGAAMCRLAAAPPP